MVQLKGEGSMTDVQLLAITYPNNVTKDGKTRYLDIQVNADDPRVEGQTNLHAVTKREKGADGKDRYNSSAPYTLESKDGNEPSQYDKIKEAGQTVEVPGRNGKDGPTVTSFTGSLMVKNGQLLVNTAKPLTAGPEIDQNVLTKQFEATKANKEARTAAAEAEKNAPQAEAPSAEAEGAGVEDPAKDDGPGLG